MRAARARARWRRCLAFAVVENVLPSRTVLLVDDDGELREAIADVLRDEGYALAEAGSAPEALARLRELGRPCVVLLDLVLPPHGGQAVLEELPRLDGGDQVRVIVVSGARGVDREARLSPHQVGFLGKPFDVDELLRLIEQAWALAAPSQGASRV